MGVTRGSALKRVLGLMLCCHQLEIVNAFLTRGPTFSFCAVGPTNLAAGPSCVRVGEILYDGSYFASLPS